MRGAVGWTVALQLMVCHRPPPRVNVTARTVRVGEPLEIAALNPAIETNGFSAEAHYLVFDSLVARNSDLNPVPRLLERWHAAEDGRRLRLVLRRGIRFQDGHPLSADDLIYTFEEIRRPANHCPFATDLSIVSRMTRVDDQTVDLEFIRPAHHFVDGLEFGLLPRHLLAGQSAQNALFSQHPVGAGP